MKIMTPQEEYLTTRAALLNQAHTLGWRALSAALGAATDQLLLRLWAQIEPEDDALGRARLWALGSYGRGELAGFSDLDLLIELPDHGADLRPAVQHAIERFMASARLARVKLAQRVRTPAQGAEELGRDWRTPISLLDARPLRPDPAPDLGRVGRDEALSWLRGQDGGRRFVAMLLQEHRLRREDHARAVALLEPDMKLGAGGLRDLHTLRWASQVRGLPAPEVDAALGWLLGVRHMLHAGAGRKQDRLTFAEQRRLARDAGLTDPLTAEPLGTLEELMEAHYRVTRQLCLLVDRTLRAWATDEPAISTHHAPITPLLALEHIHAASHAAARLEPALEAAIIEAAPGWGEAALTDEVQARLTALWLDVGASERFGAMLLELGALPALLPELAPLICHVQPDVSHVYTTDEHTLRCMERARRLVSGKPDAAADRWGDFRGVAERLHDPGLLLLAALCHDIGKNRGGDHSELGAAMVLETIAPRLGLEPARAARLAMLVREHLLLSKIARRRDISDPVVIDEVAKRVGDPELLDQLTALTFCDMSTVAPDAVTDWIATLLITLYRRARAQLAPAQGEPPSRATLVARRVEEIGARLLRSGLEDEEERARQMARAAGRQLPQGHLLHAELDALCRQAWVLAEATERGGSAALTWWTPLPDAGVLELLVVAPDAPGLLARIAGAMTTAGLTVLTAEILTTQGKQALDLFRVTPATPGVELADVIERGRLARLKAKVERVLAVPMEEVDAMVARYLAERRLAPAPGLESPVAVKVLPDVSESANVLEIRAPDRPGLLYTIARTLHGLGVDTTFSKLDIVGPRVVDTFYVGDARGRRLEAEALSGVVERLETALAAMV
jgi:[protein-PII] uridylyltransferase